MTVRTFKMKLGKKQYKLAVSFSALEAIADSVMDPLEIVREIGLEEEFKKSGIKYTGNFQWKTSNLVKIIQAGLEANGSELDYDEIGALVMSTGVANVIEPVALYLGELVQGQSHSESVQQKLGETEDSGEE